MTKIAFASGFITGALCISIFLGNQTSTLGQSASPLIFEKRGYEPIVPPLQGNALVGNNFSSVRLDGVECTDCKFGGKVTIVYSGGYFNLKNPTFKTDKINVDLRGAAYNTILLLNYLEAIAASKAPPKQPRWSLPVKKPSPKMDWITPIRR